MLASVNALLLEVVVDVLEEEGAAVEEGGRDVDVELGVDDGTSDDDTGDAEVAEGAVEVDDDDDGGGVALLAVVVELPNGSEEEVPGSTV